MSIYEAWLRAACARGEDAYDYGLWGGWPKEWTGA